MRRITPTPEVVTVPARYPCSVMWVDESSAKQSGGGFFVVATVKTRRPGTLLREVQRIRDEQSYFNEFKFSTISRGKLPVYSRLVDILEASDAHIAACVVDRSLPGDPFRAAEPSWRTHARVTSKLLAGTINRRELASALIDQVSTPVGVAFDDTVRTMVNGRLHSTGLVSAVCADSRCNDGLQLADLVAGAVSLHRRAARDPGSVNPNSHKAKIAARLAAAFGVRDFGDIRTERVNIATHGRVKSAKAILRTVAQPAV